MNLLCQPHPLKSGSGAKADIVKPTVLVWSCFFQWVFLSDKYTEFVLAHLLLPTWQVHSEVQTSEGRRHSLQCASSITDDIRCLVFTMKKKADVITCVLLKYLYSFITTPVSCSAIKGN